MDRDRQGRIDLTEHNVVRSKPLGPPREQLPIIQRVRIWLNQRKYAYQRVFEPNKYTEEVLHDLARFCRACDSTYHNDPRLHAVLEGRREVFLRIQHHLKLDPDQFWKKYGKADINGD